MSPPGRSATGGEGRRLGAPHRVAGLVAADTSFAIPLLVRDHVAHRAVVQWWAGRAVALAGHAVVETYAVLTRLPGSLRLAPHDAVRLVFERFEPALDFADIDRVPAILAAADISGGATYDAIVGLAAARAGVPLVTRDARALPTYAAVGAEVLIAP